MNNTYIIIALVAVVLIGGGLYVSMQPPEPAMEKEVVMEEKQDAMMEKDGAMEKAPEGAMMSAGQYIPYAPEKLAMAETGDVVLFFRASWCPTCRAVDADIRAHLKDIPKDVTILDVNYDNSTALKQKYGVTYQHTFVQVDAKGNQIAKWSASPTLAAIVANLK